MFDSERAAEAALRFLNAEHGRVGDLDAAVAVAAVGIRMAVELAGPQAMIVWLRMLAERLETDAEPPTWGHA